jgi:hypothetical protein
MIATMATTMIDVIDHREVAHHADRSAASTTR